MLVQHNMLDDAIEFMTRREMADFLKVTPRQMINLEAAGLPCYRLLSSVRYRRDEVLAFLEENRTLKRNFQRRQRLSAIKRKNPHQSAQEKRPKKRSS